MLKDTVFGYLLSGILISLGTVLGVPDGCPAYLRRDKFLRSYGDRCYQFFLDQHLTWSRAERDCVLRGGHLASVRDMGEEFFLTNSLRSLNLVGRGVWIGLNDRDYEGKFVWTSGDSVDFTYWAPGQANTPLDRRSLKRMNTSHKLHMLQKSDTQRGAQGRRFLLGHGGETHLLPSLTDGSGEDCVLLKYSDSGHWHDYPCEKLDLLGLVPEIFPYICQYPRNVMTSSSATTPITSTTEVVKSSRTLHFTATTLVSSTEEIVHSTRAPHSTVTTPTPNTLSTTMLPKPTSPANSGVSTKISKITKTTSTEINNEGRNSSYPVATKNINKASESARTTNIPLLTTRKPIGIIIQG